MIKSQKELIRPFIDENWGMVRQEVNGRDRLMLFQIGYLGRPAPLCICDDEEKFKIFFNNILYMNILSSN